jgi:bacillithiol biosynthesis cysteine-adding enzyme BshC
MATEDHDFDEINYFNFNGKKIKWDRPSSGAVGDLDLDGLDKVLEVFSEEIGNSEYAKEIKSLFKSAYTRQENLAKATQFLANELFKRQGLVILDANDKDLKRLFIPCLETELIQNISFEEVTRTNEQINAVSKDYKIQVNPREINLFYIKKGLRERIVESEGVYSVYGIDINWSEKEILEEVNAHPERFSPNVILRPLYQEVVLPNLCYIGGGGELAYWFQLKSNFKSFDVPFPMLLLRNSVLIMDSKQSGKLKKLNLNIKELFLGQDDLVVKKVKELSKIKIDFSSQKEHLLKQFENLHALAEKTDRSFLGAVNAQERKQIKGLEHLEKRMLRAQKRKYAEATVRIKNLQDELFPGKSLQERNLNFSQLYVQYGEKLINILLKELKPLSGEFLILEM